MSDQITNEAGEVALKYHNQAQVLSPPDTPSGKRYVFVVKANISMAWVDAQDVDHLLKITKQCCGNNRKQQFFLANENDVRRWTNGGGR